jgi:ABC-type phosphate transport system substrate-binding protein
MRLLRIALAAAALSAGGARLEAQSATYVVVVSDANPITSITRDELSRLFLKKVTVWRGVGTIVPVDQPESSPVRRTFTRDVHHREVPSVKNYWQQMIFAGRAIPPAERASDEDVISFVRGNRLAIGYVSASAPLGAGVKPVAVRVD